MVSRSELYNDCLAQLQTAGNEDAVFELNCVFQDIFGERFPIGGAVREKIVPQETEENIRNLVSRRAEGFPLQYLLGAWEFYGYDFKVGEGVLIPRPDTETIVDHILDICRRRNMNSPKIADLCSGSGCIAVTLKKELPQATVYALELSEKAFAYLNTNANRNDANIHPIMADVLSEGVAASFEELDIIVSNPPYLTEQDMNELQKEVSYEPEMALFGGNDGLDFYREIPKLWKRSLKNNGIIAFEIGMDQHTDVAEILASEGYTNIGFIKDTAGIIRVVSAEKQEEKSNG